MRRFVSFAVLFAALGALATAQTPKAEPKKADPKKAEPKTSEAKKDAKPWEPPAVPEGWRAVVSKDGTYRFAVPKATTRSGMRDRSLNTGGLRARYQIDYAQLQDGTAFEVQIATFTGAALKGAKVSDVTSALLEGEAEEGFEVSAPKPVTLGNLKGNEYRLTKDKLSRRLVMVSVKPRIVSLNVASTDDTKLDDEAAETFLKSFVLVPADVVAAARKEAADKLDAVVQANAEKLGFKWTLDAKELAAPDAPAVGLIRGRDFKPDAVRYVNGQLTFRQGKEVFAEVEVVVSLDPKAGEGVVDRTYEFAPGKGFPAGAPRVELAVLDAKSNLPARESYPDKYALKLTFGALAADGTLPGTVSFCAPDAARSYFAGTFKATTK